MDIQMPEMDGLEATKLIRSELPAQQQPYIVAVSASVLVEDREACTRAGMDDYLPKPLRVGDLDSALCRAGAASGMSRSPTAISAPASASVCAP
jgi:CheY-like chemotaxis protein